ncbi:MAG TPA: PepSY domain-containing protein [Devosiaceae bacterium]
MKRLIAIGTLAALIAGPAMAAGTCATSPQSQWKPQADLVAMLKKDGLTVRQIKVEKGCYEVYAVDASGKRVNAAYNAETLVKLSNAEAGEG